MMRIDLNGDWQGKIVGGADFNAHVPGCSINDLVQNGFLPEDLLVGKNADSVLKYEKNDWVYTKVFHLDKVLHKTKLSFERIDTYADIYLNGQVVAHTENGNIGYSFDVSTLVKKGENVLEVYLYSPINKVEGLPLRVGAFTVERLYTRRMQCTYGWDWVARFVGVGIGKTELICLDKDQVETKSVYIFTEKVQSNSAYVKFEVEFEKTVNKDITFEVLSENGEVVFLKSAYIDSKECAICAQIENALLWYPVGYGKQPLYLLRVKDGDVVLREEKFGIRTIEILEKIDEKGSDNYLKCLQIKNPEYDFNEEYSGFTLAVNGIKIMCKGANWVPCQPYEMKGKKEKITKTLELAIGMGLNMVRVWGGGAFECEHFYNECSRLGILVTQDFLMACGEYPEKEEWFLQHLQKEAEYACYLMRNQPCLVWYSGDNENAVQGSFDDEDYTGKTAYEKGLRPVVNKLDRTRKFFASSPYGGKKFASNTVGTTHNTQFLGSLFSYIESKDSFCDYKEELKKYRARFIAEEPIFGAVSLSSLKKFMCEDEIFANDLDAWLYHTKGNPALGKELMEYMITFAEGVLGKFKNPKDRYFKFKYFLYEWLRVVMEQARREKWFCSGIIFWMLNDCWTASSGWALIDYFVKPKLGFYSFKRCAKPILCSIDFENGKYALSISNDGLKDCSAKVDIYKVKKGSLQLVDNFDLFCPQNDNISKELSVSLSQDEVLIANLKSSINDCRAFYKHGGLELCKIENAIESQVKDGEITLIAKEYVHAIELEGEAIFEDNGFSMMQGEKKTISYCYMQDATDKTINIEAYTLE